MAHVLTDDEKTTQRTPGQWSRTFLAVPAYHTIYTALLNGIPSDNDMVAEISFDNGSGTLGNVLADMTLYVGTSPGAFDLGMCRIRKAPISGTFYIGEVSDIVWADNAYLTVVDDYSIWQKSLRIVSEVPFMDWDVAYSNQHASFDPVPAMGTHRVKKLVGASVDVTLGPAADTPAWVIGSSISSRSWSVSGASLDNAAAVNPVATFTAPGTYLAYCTFTAANGKTFKGVRYVIIYDDDNPLIEDFEINDGRYSEESGGGSFGVTLFNDMGVASLRERSLVILCTEDYNENGAVDMPHPITGAENIIACGYISDFDNRRDNEKGEITFTVESPQYWLAQIRDYPSGLLLSAGAAAAWTDMPSMTVRHALWHFLHWRSTATRVMDIQITDDSRLSSRFQTARGNLWDRLIQVAQPTIYARPIVDPFGRLFIEIELQMEAEVDRDFPVVMTITDNDIEGEIQWVRREVNPLSMLFWSGIKVDSSTSASSYFSISPGRSYGHHGEEDAQDNYLVGSQAKSNSMCGCFFGWRNNEIPNLEIQFVHSFRMPSPAPRQYFYFEISAADDPRGIGFAGNLIPREWAFSIDPDKKFLATAVIFEPEAAPGAAVNGDVPTMEDYDFSFPSEEFPSLPLLPALPPISLPVDVLNPNHPKKVVVATDQGVFYTVNCNEDYPTWQAMNNGLSETDIEATYKHLIVTPSGALWLICGDDFDNNIYRAAGLGGVWTLMANGNTVAVAHSLNIGKILGMGVNPDSTESVCVSFGLQTTLGGTKSFRLAFSSGGALSIADEWASSGTVRQQGVVYNAGKWYVFYTTGDTYLGEFNTSGALLNSYMLTTNGSIGVQAVANGEDFIYWDRLAGGTPGFYLVDAAGGITGIDTFAPARVNPQGLAMSPDGTHGMGAGASVYTPYKSTDSGASWSSVGGTIPVGSDIWENCGDNNRWLFGGGMTLKLTLDQGATGPIDKSGNITVVAPLVDIMAIRFIE